MPTCWLIRAGEKSSHAREFVDGAVVALGWPDVEGLGDLGELTAAEIREALEQVSHIKVPAQDTSELLLFRDQVQIGDIVVTPDARTREVLVGEVLGAYEYRNPSPVGDYRHVRDMQWLSRIERSDLPAALDSETKWRRTIRELGHQDEWRAVAEEARAGRGRPPSARGQSGLRGPIRTPKRDPEVPVRLCAGCGLARALPQFVSDSDLCVDCRSAA